LPELLQVLQNAPMLAPAFQSQIAGIPSQE
jgi:hypothetical protein